MTRPWVLSAAFFATISLVGCDSAKDALNQAKDAAEGAMASDDTPDDGGGGAATAVAPPDNVGSGAGAPATPEPMTPEQVIAKFQGMQKNKVNDTHLKELAALSSGLDQITQLDLTGAQLGPAGLEALGKLTALKSLSLRGLKVQQQAYAPLGNLTNLEVFTLEDSTFGDPAAPCLLPMTEMRELTLSGTTITDEAFRGLAGMQKLEVLRVARTQINGAGMQVLKGPPLRVIEAGQTQFGQQGLKYVKRLSTLEVLAVNEAYVGNEALQQIKSCKGLKELMLSGNPTLHDRGVQCLKSLKNLERLSLSGNKAVTNVGLIFAIHLKNLKELDVNGTGCNDLAAKQLKEKLPDAKILYKGLTL